MAKLFGFDHARFRRPGRLVVGQVAEFELPPIPQPRRLFAFSLPVGGGPPRCLDFADDSEGHRALARHCRSDNVIKVVLGVAVDVHHADVINLQVENANVVDAQPLAR